MAYLSLLTTREVFEEVHLGFLMVGHTHEDVDAMFGHFSESLMRSPAYTLPHLMSLLMKARKPNPVPHFLQEVPDFKSYLKGFLLTGSDKLVGHLKPRQFRFYVRDDKMPCLQYKMKSDDEGWLPKEGIEMWGWTDDHSPKLPAGVPKRLPMSPMKMLTEVQTGPEKYVEFFQGVHDGILEETSKRSWALLVEYWSTIVDTLKTKDVQYRPNQLDTLVHGFWPVSTWRHHVQPEYRTVACALEVEVDYVGPQKDKPAQAFHPRIDVAKGHFVLVRPDDADLNTYPVHMGLVVTDVQEGGLNEENEVEHMCDIEWYRPVMPEKHYGSDWSIADRWLDCWNKKWE
ncbi:unnamed protein product [Calypogeia fissa]